MKTYIDIDSIFDTRIAIINHMSEKRAKKIAKDKNYSHRLSDDFSKIDKSFNQARFEELWSVRGDLDLGPMVATSIVFDMLYDTCQRDMVRASGVDLETETLIVNTFPYAFTAGELDDLRSVLEEDTAFESVTFVSYNLDLLTPTYFNTGFGKVYMYDLDSWLKSHIKALEKTTLFKVEFTCPLHLKGKLRVGMSLNAVVENVKMELRGFLKYDPQPSSKYCFVIE